MIKIYASKIQSLALFLPNQVWQAETAPQAGLHKILKQFTAPKFTHGQSRINPSAAASFPLPPCAGLYLHLLPKMPQAIQCFTTTTRIRPLVPGFHFSFPAFSRTFDRIVSTFNKNSEFSDLMRARGFARQRVRMGHIKLLNCISLCTFPHSCSHTFDYRSRRNESKSIPHAPKGKHRGHEIGTLSNL